MSKHIETAIFLNRIHYSETSLIATFFTRSSGLQTYLFQGGKKKSQSLFPLSICEITTYRRADSSLGKLTEAQANLLLLEIQTNPLKSVIAFFMADIIRQIVREGQEDESLFEFLHQHITALENTDQVGLFVVQFLCQLTEPLGIQPSSDLASANYFILKDGEFTLSTPLDSQSFGGTGVQLLHAIFRKADVLFDDPQSRQEALHILLAYYAFHIPGFNVDRSLEIVIETLYH
jgi:DNA repair protein RecO (recombination protein O)